MINQKEKCFTKITIKMETKNKEKFSKQELERIKREREKAINDKKIIQK